MREAGTSTRERILDAALELFTEQGYDKASLRELAQRMGFTKAALYYHFPSKADILMALHMRMHGLLDGPMAILDEGPVSTEIYEKFLDACVDGIQANQKLFALHRVNQAALGELHNHERHEGSHVDMEERARRLFSDPALTPVQRLRMAAAFAVAFVTPVMAEYFKPPTSDASADEDLVRNLKQLVSLVLHAT